MSCPTAKGWRIAGHSGMEKAEGSGCCPWNPGGCRNRYRTDADWHASSPSRCSGPTGDLQNRRSYSRRRPYPSASCRWGESTVFGKLSIEEARLVGGLFFIPPTSSLCLISYHPAREGGRIVHGERFHPICPATFLRPLPYPFLYYIYYIAPVR